MRRYLLAGALTGTIVAAIYAAPAATQSRPAAPAVRIQAGDGGTLGLVHTVRFEGAVSPSIDGGVASVYIAQGAGGVLSVSGTTPIASSGGLTPTVSLTPCPAGQIYKSDGGGVGCAADEQGVTSVTGTAPITSSGGATPAISCSMATTGAAGCVSSLAQSFSGTKTFLDNIIAAMVSGNPDLTIRSTGTSNLTLESASGVVYLSKDSRTLRHAETPPHTFTISVDSTNLGRSTLAIDNANTGEEPSYATDLDIVQGRLKVCSTDRIFCDGSGVFTSISSGNWGAHGHTDAGGGGTLAASAIASGTMAVARGGTGLASATSDSVMVGNGSAWEAKALTDCDATGARVQFDTTGNAFSCATLGTWTTISSFSNSWDDCTAPPRYRKDADGRVSLSGCIYNGTVGSAAFTLGTGYQPAASRGFAVATGVGAPATCYLLIASTGAVTPRDGCSNTAVYLDGVSFFTD